MPRLPACERFILAACLAATVAVPFVACAQITPDALTARSQLERRQQSEETVQRLRQGQAVQDAISRGGDPSRIQSFEQQWRDRAAEERLNSEQRLRMQSGAANTTTSPEIEQLRMQAERDALRQAQDSRPTWGPALEPPKPRGPVAPRVVP